MIFGIKISEKARLFKNFIAYNVSFVLLYACIDSIASISTVLNQDGSLGTASQAIIYSVQFLTALVLPQVLIETFGFKWSLVMAEICFLLFVGANAYPRWSTMIPTSILCGFANSLAWTNLGLYFTIISKQYSVLTSQPFDTTQSLIFGWFTSIFLLCYIIGASWVGGILHIKDLSVSNFTYNYAENCGAQNCPQTPLLPSSSKPSIESVYALCGTLIGSCVLAIVVTALFVDDLKVDEELKPIKRAKINLPDIGKRFAIEFNNLVELSKSVNIWLLLPIATYLGYELTMLWFEFPRAFATCLKSINYIGWANMVFGGCGAIISFLSSYIIKYIGLQTTMIMMLMTALGHCIFMISWTATTSEAYVIFLMITTFAFTNCLATGQVRAAFGIFFSDNPSAYSAAVIFQTLGSVIGSILSIYVCVRVKVYVYMLLIALSIISYLALEVKTKYVTEKKKPLSALKKQNEITGTQTESLDSLDDSGLSNDKQHRSGSVSSNSSHVKI